jgi:menaquinone-dependent protoporphyrinogen IX oxidase
MKSLVVYKSISGFTQRYAQWIAEELASDCISIDEIGKAHLADYDLVIFGGSMHAVGINGFKRFKSYIPRIGFKKIVLFAVGASPAKAGIEEEIRLANLKEEEERQLPLFYLRGGFDYSKLDLPNKFLMLLLKLKMKLSKEKTADERGMLAAYDRPLDATRREKLEPLLDYVKAAYLRGAPKT